MTAHMSMQAEIREKTGKNVARRLRMAKMIPAMFYLKGKKEMLIALPQKEIEILHSKFDILTTVVELAIGKERYKAVPKNISLHPVTDKVEHIEFFSVGNGDHIHIKIPIKLTGRDRSIGLKRSGVLNVSKYFIDCIIKNDEITSSIEVDISQVNIGDIIRLKDLKVPNSLRFKAKDHNQVVLKIAGKRVIQVEEETSEYTEEESSENKEDNDAKAPEGKSSK